MQANGHFLPALRVEDFEKSSLAAGIPPGSWAVVAQLLCRPWFTRRWVVQEVTLAPDLVVVCGRHAVRWDELCKLCEWVADNNGILFRVMEKHCLLGTHLTRAHLQTAFRKPGSINIARDLHSAAKNPAILQQLLLRFRHFQTTDPRDRIFALVGCK